MDNKAGVSLSLTLILLISVLVLDWLYIFTIQQEAPIISHWVIALPMIIPLFFALALLALIGIYLLNIWGFLLAYFIILMSMFFSLISYECMPFRFINDDLQFITLMLFNLIVFIYIAIFNLHSSSDKPSA